MKISLRNRLVVMFLPLALTMSALQSSEVFIPDDENSWPFPMVCEDPAAASPIDLRWLNEEVAGADGPLRLSDDGADFVRADGTTMKAWLIHMPGGGKWSMDDYTQSARFYARYGVNVGIIGPGGNPADKQDPRRYDPAKLERIHRGVAASGCPR